MKSLSQPRCALKALALFRLGGFLQALVQIGILAFKHCGYGQIILFDLAEINVFDMHKPNQLPYGPRHISSTFITGAATLGDADLAPEVMLINT
jgi:hypothetical protein